MSCINLTNSLSLPLSCHLSCSLFFHLPLSLSLSLALALSLRPLCVTLVFSAKGQRYLRVGLAVPLMGTLRCLRAMVAEEGKLRPDQV